jgi:hypothetical protein
MTGHSILFVNNYLNYGPNPVTLAGKDFGMYILSIKKVDLWRRSQQAPSAARSFNLHFIIGVVK